jgi:hypothetical protein
MCIEILAKLNLRGYKPDEKKRQQMRTINDTISMTTPLSVSSPSPVSPKKRKTVTLNENVVAYAVDNSTDAVVDSVELPDEGGPIWRVRKVLHSWRGLAQNHVTQCFSVRKRKTQ